MLQEQERARASRSELLSAQAAHLRRIGDQWPAFQELQVGLYTMYQMFTLAIFFFDVVFSPDILKLLVPIDVDQAKQKFVSHNLIMVHCACSTFFHT